MLRLQRRQEEITGGRNTVSLDDERRRLVFCGKDWGNSLTTITAKLHPLAMHTQTSICCIAVLVK